MRVLRGSIVTPQNSETVALSIEWPMVRPLGVPITSAAIEEVWGAFVVPTQADDAPPQSVEMRCLMAVLRSTWSGLVNAEAALAAVFLWMALSGRGSE